MASHIGRGTSMLLFASCYARRRSAYFWLCQRHNADEADRAYRRGRRGTEYGRIINRWPLSIVGHDFIISFFCIFAQ